jgi:hypothetical protein
MDGNEIAARLVKLKGAKAECPQCERTKWATAEPNGRALLIIDNGLIQEVKRLVILICDNCGFVRLHDEQKLHD